MKVLLALAENSWKTGLKLLWELIPNGPRAIAAPQSGYSLYQPGALNFFFSIWVFFHEHSRFAGQRGKGEGIYLTPLYNFHPLRGRLGIGRAGSSPLRVAGSRAWAGGLWFSGAGRWPPGCAPWVPAGVLGIRDRDPWGAAAIGGVSGAGSCFPLGWRTAGGA